MLWAIEETEEKVKGAISEIRSMVHPASKGFSLDVVFYDGFVSKDIQRRSASLVADTESGVRFYFWTWSIEEYWKFRNIERLEKFLFSAVHRKDAVKREIDRRIAKYQKKVARKWEMNFDGLRS